MDILDNVTIGMTAGKTRPDAEIDPVGTIEKTKHLVACSSSIFISVEIGC